MDSSTRILAVGTLQFEHLSGAVQQHAQVDQHFLSRRLLGKSQQVGDQIASPLGLVHNLAHQPVLFVGEPLFRPELLGIAHDGVERMVNLVGGARHQVCPGKPASPSARAESADRFWLSYPRRDSRSSAISAWS